MTMSAKGSGERVAVLQSAVASWESVGLTTKPVSRIASVDRVARRFGIWLRRVVFENHAFDDPFF